MMRPAAAAAAEKMVASHTPRSTQGKTRQGGTKKKTRTYRKKKNRKTRAGGRTVWAPEKGFWPPIGRARSPKRWQRWTSSRCSNRKGLTRIQDLLLPLARSWGTGGTAQKRGTWELKPTQETQKREERRKVTRNERTHGPCGCPWTGEVWADPPGLLSPAPRQPGAASRGPAAGSPPQRSRFQWWHGTAGQKGHQMRRPPPSCTSTSGKFKKKSDGGGKARKKRTKADSGKRRDRGCMFFDRGGKEGERHEPPRAPATGARGGGRRRALPALLVRARQAGQTRRGPGRVAGWAPTPGGLHTTPVSVPCAPATVMHLLFSSCACRERRRRGGGGGGDVNTVHKRRSERSSRIEKGQKRE